MLGQKRELWWYGTTNECVSSAASVVVERSHGHLCVAGSFGVVALTTTTSHNCIIRDNVSCQSDVCVRLRHESRSTQRCPLPSNNNRKRTKETSQSFTTRAEHLPHHEISLPSHTTVCGSGSSDSDSLYGASWLFFQAGPNDRSHDNDDNNDDNNDDDHHHHSTLHWRPGMG